MKILITGDTGFLGSNTFKYLTLKGHDVYGCSRRHMTDDTSIFISATPDGLVHYNRSFKHYGLDLANHDDIKRMLAHCKPDYILHFAATPLVKNNEEKPGKIIDDNVKVTQLLCHYAAPGTKIIFSSSITVYGKYSLEFPPCEGDYCNPISIYAATKLASENIICSHKHINYVNLRLGAIVGPNMTHGIVHDFIAKLNSENPVLEVLGDKPGSYKPFMHISDFYTVLDYVMNGVSTFKPGDGGRTYNVCNIDLLTVDNIANLVKTTLNIDKPTMWLGEKANWRGDNSLLNADITNISQDMDPINYWHPSLYSEQAVIKAVLENV